MIKRIVSFALHQPMFMGLMAILFVTGGIVAFKSLPIEVAFDGRWRLCGLAPQPFDKVNL